MSELRKGFESWLSTKFISLDGGLNEWTGQFEYVYPRVQSMWVAWQAATMHAHNGHAEFVMAVQNLATKYHIRPTTRLIEIEELCADELAKESNNG